MRERRSESAYEKGLAAVARGEFLTALALFEACIEMDAKAGARLPIAAMSYYGLCLSLVSDRLGEARDICEAAVEASPRDPDLYLNLGRVCQRQDDRAHAFRTYIRGLRIDPRHPGLVDAIRSLGFRRRPVLGFLPRRHPVNRVLGALRAAVDRGSRRRARGLGRAVRAA